LQPLALATRSWACPINATGNLLDEEGCFLPQAGRDWQLGRIAFAACRKFGLFPTEAAQFLGDAPLPLGLGRFPAQFPKVVFPELALPALSLLSPM
jgi:hypothetical protein